MAVDDRLSDLLVEWDEARTTGAELSLEELCRETPELLSVVKESIESLKATEWMFASQASAFPAGEGAGRDARAALQDTALPASHLTVAEFAASVYQSGLLSREEIDELKRRIETSDLPGEAREVASRLVDEGKLTRYQASVLLKASKDPLLVDNYVILDTLDTGGMGLVFKAVHRSMDRVVALKLLPASMMSARDTVKRFQREMKAAAALQHPNIVAAYDADESEEIAYLVLEYVEGTNLFRWVKEQGPLSVAHAADCIRQAATGLAYLHARGIIHRDVKPANLILATDGTVKLLDMGLVRFASSEDLSCIEMDQELTQAGIVIGTVAYMSPEQALDTRSADQRSDIYSLGCTLFFLLTGRSLYHEETGMKTLLAHREQSVPSIRQFREDVPVVLDSVFRAMVAKRPGDRMQHMSDVITAIDECLPQLSAVSPGGAASGGASGVSRPISLVATQKQPRFFSKHRALVGAGLAVVGLLMLAAVIVIRIKTENGTASVTIETEPDAPAAGTKKEPGAASHLDTLDLRSPEVPAPHVSGGTDLVEVSLGQFNVLRESETNVRNGAMNWINFNLVVTVQSKFLSRMQVDKETHKARITGAVRDAIHATTGDDLDDPEATQLKANLKKQINAVLPEAYVQQIILQGWNPQRRLRRNKGRKANTPPAEKSNDQIEFSLGEFGAPLAWEGTPQEARINLLAVINPDVEDTLNQIVNVTHEGRVREAIASVLHTLTTTEVRDLEHKQLKESLAKAINDVLPQPYIHQIVVQDLRVTDPSEDEEKNAHEKDKAAKRPKSNPSAPPSSKGAKEPSSTGQSKTSISAPIGAGDKTGH
jgi:serine/threonine protein kinase/flagellar basal body-associated protein FliL